MVFVWYFKILQITVVLTMVDLQKNYVVRHKKKLYYHGTCPKIILIQWYVEKRLGYVCNPRSLMEGTETLCRDDIGDLPGSPEHL